MNDRYMYDGKLTLDDLIRETSRVNFKHVNMDYLDQRNLDYNAAIYSALLDLEESQKRDYADERSNRND